jgi:hypothetical protein
MSLGKPASYGISPRKWNMIVHEQGLTCMNKRVNVHGGRSGQAALTLGDSIWPSQARAMSLAKKAVSTALALEISARWRAIFGSLAPAPFAGLREGDVLRWPTSGLKPVASAG